jgi:uncharacterized protein YdhG (YjbR/CyaY superfamily)
MAKTDFKSIDEYHENFSDEALERMNTIRALVHKIAPDAQEVISYQIPAFKIDQKIYLIYYCAFAKHISISSPWSEAFLKEFEQDLKGMKVSKSVIQFPLDEKLPITLITRILKFRKKESEQKLKKTN